MKELKIGTKGRADAVVTHENSAAACDPSLPEVFSTPKLVELIEAAGIRVLESVYDENELSVGVAVNIVHMASSPLGMKVYAEAEVAEINRTKIVFNVTAFDEKQQICKGSHTRAVVDKAMFSK